MQNSVVSTPLFIFVFANGLLHQFQLSFWLPHLRYVSTTIYDHFIKSIIFSYEFVLNYFLFFGFKADLDDTLYSSKLGIAEPLRKNIDGTWSIIIISQFWNWFLNTKQTCPPESWLFIVSHFLSDFLVEKCGFAEDKASRLRVELFKTYGSSLAGLRVIALSNYLLLAKLILSFFAFISLFFFSDLICKI